MPKQIYATESLKEFIEQRQMNQLHTQLYTDFDGPSSPNDYGIHFLDTGDFIGLTPVMGCMTSPEEYISRVLINYFQETHNLEIIVYALHKLNNPGIYTFIITKKD